MIDESEVAPSIPTLIQYLKGLSKEVDQGDLPGLAKMHEACGKLLECAAAETNPEASRLTDLARDIGGGLEGLILGEVDDALVAMEAVLAQVSRLGAFGLPLDPESPEQSEQTAVAEVDSTSTGGEPPASELEGKDAPPCDESQPAECDSSGESTVAKADAPDVPVEPPYEQEPLHIDEDSAELLEGFLEEASEHLDAVEAAVLDVERTPGDIEKMDTLFRPFHTIKGAAGFLNLRDINSLTHEAETLLDQARKGERSITPGMIDLIFEVVDVLKVQTSAIGTYLAAPNGDVVPQPPVVELIGRLRDVVGGRREPAVNEPSGGSSAQKLGQNLVDQGAVPQEVVDFAVDERERNPDGKKVGEILVDMGVATPKQVSKALRPQATNQKASTQPAGSQKAVGEQSVRIETAKLDALVDMVGELVIAQTLVGANPQIEVDPKLTKDVGQVMKIVRDVQEVSMAMRMIPIGPTFQKMARLVRDVSRKVDKHVELVLSGEDTELDKNVIQQIGDPLVHMTRNAVDHGIEPPEVRLAAGKPEVGQVHLSAFHQGGNIVIQIRDDGKGLDPKKLIAKAIEKGVIAPGDDLTDQEAYQLIFAPGFSMAGQVTGISGRGVGMDVVRRNIEQLRGKVEITSELGKGSTFMIRLPLTLAIIDGMVMRVGSERFIIQTITIQQALRPERSQVTTVQQRGEVLNVRGRLIPLIQLGALFGLTEPLDPCEAMVVIAQCDDHQIGLVVDQLIGQQQVVIKSLGDRFEKLRGVSGAAILGDGRVGLILEMSGLAAAHEKSYAAQGGTELPRPRTLSDGEPSVADPTPATSGINDTEPVLITA